MSSRKIKKCRLCNHQKFKKIIDFGKVPLGNNLSVSKKSSLLSEAYKLCLIRCNNCKHFQLDREVKPEKLYATNYTYLSGIAPSFIKHFKDYADWVEKKCNIKKNNIILDIGSNDGTCLMAFKEKRFNVLGIDPAKLPSDRANKLGITTVNAFFNRKSSINIKKKYGEIDFITSHNVLAHIGRIDEVFKSIYYLLKQEGYFCFEVGYFLKVLQNNYFDTIYHEHLDYHHAAPLIKYLTKIGFSIVNISTNKVQGGTIRILCKKTKKIRIYSQPCKFLNREKYSIINNQNFLKEWPHNINNNIKKFESILKNYSKQNKVILGYGAPTKATLILKIANIKSNIVSQIIEDNGLKVGKYMPLTNIKIKKYDKNIIKKSDIIIIFAWNFFSDIVRKLRSDRITNVTVVVPLPKVRIFNL